MDLRNIRLEDIGKKKITIGKVAENLRTCIGFDCAGIFAEYPDAVPALTVINPKGVSYPAIVQRSGDSVLWEIRDSDLTAAGTGEIQLSFVQDEVIAKSYTGRIEIIRSIQSTGEAPDPITEWETEADAKLAEVAQALEDIPQAIDNALEAAKESGEFDGPPGQDGRDGQDGAPGSDGVSPTVTVTDITGGHRITITDATGSHSFDVMDGETPENPVTDVQVDGTSILDDGVANIPFASADDPGVAKAMASKGVYLDESGSLVLSSPNDTQIKQLLNGYMPVKLDYAHKVLFYALSKVAGVDLGSESVTLGQYPDSAKVAIQKMLGVRPTYGNMEKIAEVTLTEDMGEVVVSTDMYGQPFKLAHAEIILAFGTQPTGLNDYIRASVQCPDNAWRGMPTLRLLPSSQCWLVFNFIQMGGIGLCFGKSSSTGNSQAPQLATFQEGTNNPVISTPYIKGVYLWVSSNRRLRKVVIHHGCFYHRNSERYHGNSHSPLFCGRSAESDRKSCMVHKMRCRMCLRRNEPCGYPAC